MLMVHTHLALASKRLTQLRTRERASSESLESRMGYLATNIEIRPLQLDIVLKNIGVNWEATMNHYFQTVHHVRGSRELSG